MKIFRKRKPPLIVVVMLILFTFVFSIPVNASTKNLEIKNEKCVLQYKIDDMEVKNGLFSFTFKIDEKESKNIFSAKVEVKDEDGNLLAESPEDAEGDYTEKVVYRADVSDSSIKKVKIIVYAFDESFQFIDEIDMSKVPYKTTVIDIKDLKEHDINTDGGEKKPSFIKSFLKSNGFTIALFIIIGTVYLVNKKKLDERKQINDRKQK